MNTSLAAAPGRPAVQTHTVEIVIPVLNEERALPGAIRTVCDYLDASFPLPWRLTIVDNGSTDATWDLAVELSASVPGVHAMRLERQGKGAAVKEAWRRSTADIVAFMDVDLSTGLHALLPMISAVASGHCEVAIGTRLANGARVQRGMRRELMSRVYNGLLRIGFAARFSDATCGFKAARTEVIRPILAKVEDDRWFFDTEMLLLTQYNGARIREVPVDWVEDADSRVNVLRVVWGNLRGLVRVSRAMAEGTVRAEIPPVPALHPAHPDAVLAPSRLRGARTATSFVLVGVLSTLLHLGLYVCAREVLAMVVANLLALTVTGFVHNEVNRRWSINRAAVRRLSFRLRQGLLFALTYAVTTAALYLAGGEAVVLLAVAPLLAMARLALLNR